MELQARVQRFFLRIEGNRYISEDNVSQRESPGRITVPVLIAILMSIYEAERGRLVPLIERLPFEVDDIDSVNQTYIRWRKSGSSEAMENVLVWGYCYIYDYFLTRFVHERVAQASDFDYLVTRVYTRVQRKLDSVKDPDRFVAWVSVICGNALKNFRRDRKDPTEDVKETLQVTDPRKSDVYDRKLVQRALTHALEALPPSLREIATMKLVNQLEYREISKKTNRPIASVRTLMSRALTRLRKDPHLQALYLGTDLDA